MNTMDDDDTGDVTDDQFSFCYDYQNIQLKFELSEDGFKIFYDNAKDSQQEASQDDYNFIGTIKQEDNEMATILTDECPNPCFSFLIVLNENTSQTNLQKLNLNCGVYITNDLYRVLFQDNNNTAKQYDPVLMIATHEGYLYNLPIIHSVTQDNYANIQFKALSPILYLDVYLITDQVTRLFESSKDKRVKKFYNCIFLITKSGEIFVYSYLNEYKFKMQTILHQMRVCIRFNDHIFYCSNECEVYYFSLKDLLADSIKVKYVQKLNVCDFYEENSKLYANTVYGRKVEIHEPKEGDKGTETCKDSDDKPNELNTLMNKFHSLSNQITHLQGDLDKLDTSLKQIQMLKKSEIDEHGENKNDELFEASLKIKSIDSVRYFQIKLKNKSLILEETSTNSQTEAPIYMALIAIQLTNDDTCDTIWLNKKSIFSALKPSDTQKFLIDTKSIIGNNYKPTGLSIHLIYNLKNALTSSLFKNYQSQKSNNEYRVCIYNSKIELKDYLLKKSFETLDLETSSETNRKLEDIKLNFCWKQMKLINLDKNNLNNSFINYIFKNQIKKSEGYIDLFSNLSFKIDSIDQNLFNLTSSINNKMHLTNLIRFKNEFLFKVRRQHMSFFLSFLIEYKFKEVFNNDDYFYAYLMNLRNSGIDLFLKDLLKELEIQSTTINDLSDNVTVASDIDALHKRSLDAAYCLLNIYLKLRSRCYSNVNFLEYSNLNESSQHTSILNQSLDFLN